MARSLFEVYVKIELICPVSDQSLLRKFLQKLLSALKPVLMRICLLRLIVLDINVLQNY